jgi:hypothetical protein
MNFSRIRQLGHSPNFKTFHLFHPFLLESDRTMNCPYCDSVNLRHSRFRSADIVHYLLLRRPVRCRTCQERSYVGLSQYRRLIRESKLKREASKASQAS